MPSREKRQKEFQKNGMRQPSRGGENVMRKLGVKRRGTATGPDGWLAGKALSLKRRKTNSALKETPCF